jgi:site-specific DNA recombinase
MNEFFGYIRVSTAKQGEQGVSLQQQREAITRYAERQNMNIIRWFEEQETAAKRGRPLFSEMMKLLRKGAVRGVLIHKIDRSARNLKDWADLGELIDGGIEVHFANESLDLNSRGGRLSADIQAVVAADYIRNLREETRKGFYGRLKQGVFPMPAPVGYLDGGPGKPKVIDPVRGPLVGLAFELYATRKFGHNTLADELYRRGLRSKSGKRVTAKRLSHILNNTFYMGVITIHKTGEAFSGNHEPVISRDVFERVQDVMHGKTNARPVKHDFLFRRRIACAGCGYHLIGETHKSFVYYRCQALDCASKTCVREEVIDTAVVREFKRIRLTDEERQYLRQEMSALTGNQQQIRQQQEAALRLRSRQIEERMNRLTDAYIDGVIGKDEFEERKKALLMERADVKDAMKRLGGGTAQLLASFLERADLAYSTYKSGSPGDKRKLLDSVTSNCSVDGKSAVITLETPFDAIANRFEIANGGPTRSIPRTWQCLLSHLAQMVNTLPVLRDDTETA